MRKDCQKHSYADQIDILPHPRSSFISQTSLICKTTVCYRLLLGGAGLPMFILHKSAMRKMVGSTPPHRSTNNPVFKMGDSFLLLGDERQHIFSSQKACSDSIL